MGANMLLLYLISRHGYSNNHDVLSRFKCSVLWEGGHTSKVDPTLQLKLTLD